MIFSRYGKLTTPYKKELLYLCITGTLITPFLNSEWL